MHLGRILDVISVGVSNMLCRVVSNKNWWFFHHRRLAKKYGTFDPDWYRSVNADVDFSVIDPFKHYVVHGWRQGRNPSPKFDAGIYSSIASDFRSEYENPVIDAIQRLNQGRLKKSDLKRIVQRDIFSHRKATPLQDGISVSGLLKSEIGLGQGARNLVHAIDTAKIPASLHYYELKGRDSNLEYASRIQEIRDRRCNLLIIPIPELPLRRHELRRGVHSILYPYWELLNIPQELHADISRYDEIWAPSSYIAEMFSPLHPKVTLVRQSLPIPELTASSRKDECCLKLLAYFDFDSSIFRKNIKAPIQAFQKSFPNQTDVRLTIKARGGNDQGAREWLADQATRDYRIRIIDAVMSREGMNQLVLECDVFISLHRSEGFGFGPAEALAAGKAVVATDYSGTKDFITHETAYPVEYDLIPVQEGEYPYWENQVWVDPRIESAVIALQTIYSDRDGAAEKGRKGREFMRCHHSPEVVGLQIKKLLLERGLINNDSHG